jgi:hypothetical protein
MRTSFLAATAVAAVAVVVGCAGVARRLRLLRRLRAGGVHAVATVRSVEERHVSVPSGFTGWVTTVAVSFTDGSGAGIEAAYAEYGARAASVGDPGGTVRIRYDPDRPTTVSPARDDPRAFEVFLLGWGTVCALALAVYFAYRASA